MRVLRNEANHFPFLQVENLIFASWDQTPHQEITILNEGVLIFNRSVENQHSVTIQTIK